MTNVNKTVDVAALDLLCDKLECGDANHRATAAQIRKAINGAKPQLPEGIEWPRFEDGELVKFGDEYVAYTGEVRCVEDVSFAHDITFVNGMSHGKPLKRPEPEVLDADGVPIKVGDTVWSVATGEEIKICSLDPDEIINVGGADGFWYESLCLTHRKSDTHGDIEDDATMPPWTYCSKVLNIEEAQTTEEMVTAMCKHLIQRTRLVCERQRKLMGGE